MTLARNKSSPAMKYKTSPVALYLTADRKQVVESGGAFVLCGAGGRISEADIAKYGLEARFKDGAPAPTTKADGEKGSTGGPAYADVPPPADGSPKPPQPARTGPAKATKPHRK